MKLLQCLLALEMHNQVDCLCLNFSIATSSLDRDKLFEGSLDILARPIQTKIVETILELRQRQVAITHTSNTFKELLYGS